MTDHFTRYAFIYHFIQNSYSYDSNTVGGNFVYYGFPETIIPDQGQNFESKLVTELCHLAATKKLRITPYHLQMNAQCERFNSTEISMLGTLQGQGKLQWKDQVATPMHAYNCTRSNTTGFSPYFLMFGRHPRLLAGCSLWSRICRYGVCKY